jgi:hypothetical protein
VHQERRWQRRRFCFATDLTTVDVLQALEATRRLATREGWRYQHVQAIIVAIDQYAEAATGNGKQICRKSQVCLVNFIQTAAGRIVMLPPSNCEVAK